MQARLTGTRVSGQSSARAGRNIWAMHSATAPVARYHAMPCTLVGLCSTGSSSRYESAGSRRCLPSLRLDMRSAASSRTATVSNAAVRTIPRQQCLQVPTPEDQMRDLLAADTLQTLYQRVTDTAGPGYLTPDQAVAAVLRAQALAASQGPHEPPTSEEQLHACAVCAAAALALLHEAHRLQPHVAAGVLAAMASLISRGYLPQQRSELPREVVVGAAQLTHTARLAANQGALGPNQVATLLHAAGLLAPHFVTAQWVAEVVQQLKDVEVLGRLRPTATAALLAALARARRLRARRWTPPAQWLEDVQAHAVLPHLAEFPPRDLARALHALVELSTPRQPLIQQLGFSAVDAPKGEELIAPGSPAVPLRMTGPAPTGWFNVRALARKTVGAIMRAAMQPQQLPMMVGGFGRGATPVVASAVAVRSTDGNDSPAPAAPDGLHDALKTHVHAWLHGPVAENGRHASTDLSAPDLALVMVSAVRVGLPGWAAARPSTLDDMSVYAMWGLHQRMAQNDDEDGSDDDSSGAD